MFRCGEITVVPDDAVVYRAIRTFWLGPHALMHVNDTVLYSPSAKKLYWTPCGYDVRGDVTIEEATPDPEFLVEVKHKHPPGFILPLGECPACWRQR